MPDPLARAQAVAACLATQPAFAEAGLDTDTLTAWGQFTDGRLHLVAFNRAPDGTPASVQAPAQRAQALAAPAHLPQATTGRAGQRQQGQQRLRFVAGAQQPTLRRADQHRLRPGQRVSGVARVGGLQRMLEMQRHARDVGPVVLVEAAARLAEQRHQARAPAVDLQPRVQRVVWPEPRTSSW